MSASGTTFLRPLYALQMHATATHCDCTRVETLQCFAAEHQVHVLQIVVICKMHLVRYYCLLYALTTRCVVLTCMDATTKPG